MFPAFTDEIPLGMDLLYGPSADGKGFRLTHAARGLIAEMAPEIDKQFADNETIAKTQMEARDKRIAELQAWHDELDAKAPIIVQQGHFGNLAKTIIEKAKKKNGFAR
jgi:hypothetical protein